LSVGSTYYLSGTPGALSTSAGTFPKAMGVADSATTLIMTVQQTVSSTGNLLVTGTLTVTGATALQSTLAVTGATTLSSTVGTGALTVTGNETVSGTLGVTGATSLSSATVSSTLGVTGAATLASTLAVTGVTTLTGGLNTPLVVAQGGSGRATATTAYAVLAAGTTATGAQQSIAPSTSGFVLTDNGVGVLPSFQVGTNVARYQTTQTANYTVDFANGASQTVLGNTNAFTVTLPTAVGAAGKTVRIIKIGSDTNAITLATTSAQTIGKNASAVLKLYAEDDYMEVESDGANYQIASELVTIRAKAFRATNQVVATGTSTKIEWNSEEYDSADAFNTGTYAFTAPRAGTYTVLVQVMIDNGVTGTISQDLDKNGTSIPNSVAITGTAQQAPQYGNLLVLAQGDVITSYITQTHGSNRSILASARYAFIAIKYVGN